MKTKKMLYRVVSAAMCLTMLGAGAQVFAATSDKYVGYSHGGTYEATITCEIAAHDGTILYDSCTASTSAAPKNLSVEVNIGIFNKNDGLVKELGYKKGTGKVSDRLYSIDRDSAASAMSVHKMSDSNYGSFFHVLGAYFSA